MRRTLAVVIIFSLIGAALAWSAALNFTPTITLTRLTTTTMRIQLAGLRATGIDTIKVYSAAADSATGPKYWFKAATTKDTTVASLTPGKTYVFKVRADSAGTYKTSVPDTMQTYYPQLNRPIQTTILDDWRQAARATAWPPTNTYTYGWTIQTASGLDSSMVYEAFPYTGSLIVFGGYASTDSTQIKVRLMAGFTDSLNVSTSVGRPYYTAVDSASYTARGTYSKSWSIPVGAINYYYELFGQTGNGNGTTVNIWQRRVRQ